MLQLSGRREGLASPLNLPQRFHNSRPHLWLHLEIHEHLGQVPGLGRSSIWRIRSARTSEGEDQ